MIIPILAGRNLREEQHDALEQTIALETTDWQKIYEFLKLGERVVEHRRATKETDILYKD